MDGLGSISSDGIQLGNPVFVPRATDQIGD
jgi:hypothetical protein